MFNPEIDLEHGERAALVQMHAMEGYKVLHRVMRSMVDTFVIEIINADPAKPDDVVAKQVLAKAAAQFFEMVTQRVNEEVTLYINTPRSSDKPVESAVGLDLEDVVIDFGGE